MYLSCVKLVLVFMLVNGSPSFSVWFCDDVMMATLFLFQLLSTVLQTDVRARGYARRIKRSGALLLCFHIILIAMCTQRNSLSILHAPSQKSD